MSIGSDDGVGKVISLDAFRRSQRGIARSLERLASGRRINRASDDASGLALSQKLEVLERASAQEARNLNDGISASRVAEGGLSETSNNLARMRELAVQGGNGTLSREQRELVQQEYDALADEVTRVSRNTEYNGRSLLSGSTQGDGAIELDAEGEQGIRISIDDHSAEALGVAERDVSDARTLRALDNAIGQVTRTRAALGATEGRLESRIRSLNIVRENTAAARSRIQDADVAAQTANVVRAQILGQSGLAVRAQANVSSDAASDVLS